MRVLVLEMLPLMTALFVALRTGAAINTEVALMQIQNELDALQRIGIDPFRLELLPRVVGRNHIGTGTDRGEHRGRAGLARILIIDLNPWSLPPANSPA